jgi:hypothetical protein
MKAEDLEAAKAKIDQLLAEKLEENESLKKEKQQVLANAADTG